MKKTPKSTPTPSKQEGINLTADEAQHCIDGLSALNAAGNVSLSGAAILCNLASKIQAYKNSLPKEPAPKS